jgi:hypothetical protein
MMTHEAHSCESRAVEYTSTPEHPYHYVNSGLDNVYLVGVRYRICQGCGKQSADVPALKGLLAEIASGIIAKPSLLTGPEVKFLRKQLSLRAIDFAAMMAIKPQSMSRLESVGAVNESRDRFIRLLYTMMSGNGRIKANPEELQRWMTSIHGKGSHERIMATWQENRQWKVDPIAA